MLINVNYYLIAGKSPCGFIIVANVNIKSASIIYRKRTVTSPAASKPPNNQILKSKKKVKILN